jgi:hypothetical protein
MKEKYQLKAAEGVIGVSWREKLSKTMNGKISARSICVKIISENHLINNGQPKRGVSSIK